MRLKTLCSLLTLAILLGIGTPTKAQDLHFSQYYASPLTLNPALTGRFDGEYRFTAIYRNQWSQVSRPLWSTPSASVDFSLFKGKLKKDAFGLGLVFVNDMANSARFNTIKIAANMAYHKGFGAEGKTQASLGIQVGYTQKSFDFNDLRFEDGFNPFDISQYNQSAEVLTGDNNSYIDLNAGLLVNSAVTDALTIYGGISVFHLTTPNEVFLTLQTGGTTNENEIPMRYVIHAGAEIDLSKRVVLIPGLLTQIMAKNKEINFGLTAGYNFLNEQEETKATIYLGAWHRYGRSFIAKAGVDWNNFRLGVAYDVNVSSLTDIKNAGANHPTAFEISLAYIGRITPPTDRVYLFNPRF